MSKRLRFTTVFATVVLVHTGSAVAATITPYSSLVAWQTAATTDWSVDFDGLFAVDTSFGPAPVDVGPFSLEQVGSALAFTRNRIEVAPYLFPLEGNGTDYASILTEFGEISVTMTFDNPLTAWGGEFTLALTGERTDLVVNFQGGGSTLVGLPADGFFGFTSDMFISSITFQSRMETQFAEGYGLDNVVGGRAVVPEPTILLLVGSGLVAVGARRLRRRR